MLLTTGLDTFKRYQLSPAPLWPIAYWGLIARKHVPYHNLGGDREPKEFPRAWFRYDWVRNSQFQHHFAVCFQNSFPWILPHTSYCRQWKTHTKLAITIFIITIQNRSGLLPAWRIHHCIDDEYSFFHTFNKDCISLKISWFVQRCI